MIAAHYGDPEYELEDDEADRLEQAEDDYEMEKEMKDDDRRAAI